MQAHTSHTPIVMCVEAVIAAIVEASIIGVAGAATARHSVGQVSLKWRVARAVGQADVSNGGEVDVWREAVCDSETMESIITVN